MEFNEWELHKIYIPNDDYDEDDELDARIEAMERKQRNHVSRGSFFGTA